MGQDHPCYNFINLNAIDFSGTTDLKLPGLCLGWFDLYC